MSKVLDVSYYASRLLRILNACREYLRICCNIMRLWRTLQVAEELVSRTKVLNWMLKRLKPRDFDVNKGAVGENLALLLQSSQANAQKAADLNGIDAILQVCSVP
jgi:hypothetical protein